MVETVHVPGSRHVRATLDRADADADDPADGTDTVVVACPPHPQQGGHRGDERLVAVSDRLGKHGIDCLRIDYGPWDEGRGEVTDAINAIDWSVERYDRVGVFGYSFGGTIALVAAADRPEIVAACALAPAARIGPEIDAVSAIASLGNSACILYGSRDTTADWQPTIEAAERHGVETRQIEADHFFVGQSAIVATEAVSFLETTLLER